MVQMMKHDEVVYTDLEEGAVLLHLETRFYYSLNEVGQAVWRLLDSAENLEDMLEKLAEEYEVDGQSAKDSVSRFLQELEREKLALPHREAEGERPHQGSASAPAPSQQKRPFVEPELIKHDEPLHEVVMNPFDPQLPLAE
ncbi:PqqD family protein [Nitrospinae bacterium AH_259_B05_G02_I21]|nr:PqqD family protein [Nitrospinae bacterium AH_259_B05_G02_I21]